MLMEGGGETALFVPETIIWTATVTQEDVKLVLDEAADLVHRLGLVQGKSYDEKGRVCAGQAIMLATDNIIRRTGLPPAMRGRLMSEACDRLLRGTHYAHVPVWNDGLHGPLKKTRVVRALRAAAQ